MLSENLAEEKLYCTPLMIQLNTVDFAPMARDEFNDAVGPDSRRTHSRLSAYKARSRGYISLTTWPLTLLDEGSC